MNQHQRTDLFNEYRTWPKWYYHIVFDSLEKGQLFNNDDEYADGMNGIAIGQYVFGLSILVFTLMVNHCHILVYGAGEDIVKLFIFMRRRINRRLKADGYPPLPENYGFKLIKVEDERQLADTIVYIARNPLKARPDIMAGGYLWGSANLIFSETNKLYEKVSLKNMSYRSTVKALRTNVKLPDEYLYSRSMGFILPESYVLNNKVTKVLGNSWRFSSALIRNIDAYVKIAEGIGEMVVLSEGELNEVIYHLITEKFNASSLKDLSIDDKCRLAIILKRKYRVDTKRIARKLQITPDVLTRLFE